MSEPSSNTLTGFNRLVGLELTGLSSDAVEATLAVDERHHQPYGIVHGGVYCTLVETLASTGAALWSMEQGMLGVVGVSQSTDFLRSHRNGPIVARATPIHRGRSQQLWLVEVLRAEDDKLLARGQVRLHNLTDGGAIGGMVPSSE